ncbi:MAG: hypothetical protein JWP34_3127 [Massilia sp.]|nr:hypothetical protein [Massilia sp.]
MLDANGARSRVALIDNHDKSKVHAVKWWGDTVLVTGCIRSSRVADGSGWDGYVARTDLKTGQLLSYRLADVDRGDIVLDLLPLANGQLLIGGATGYTQNPGGESVSEISSPLLARSDLETGSLTRLAVFAGPRGNQIRSLAVFSNNWLVGATQNMPGTHTADGDIGLLTTDAYVREFEAIN